MEKIPFRGREISELEAKIIRNLLKIGLYQPVLNKEEKKDYNEWKKLIEDSNKLKTRRKIKINERNYLIYKLEVPYLNTKPMFKMIDREIEYIAKMMEINRKKLHDSSNYSAVA